MEYKFRGKSYNGEWIFGGVMPASNGKHNAVAIWGENGITAIAVDFKTVGQFTGFRDHKRTEQYPIGQEIYTKDILEWSYISPLDGERIVKRYLVVFEYGHFMGKLIGHSPYGDRHLNFILEYGEENASFKTFIIGNEFDNLEFLEVKN